MSDRIYALLLGLFPRRFRETYAESAMQLFRDRVRDEKGALLRFRLGLDLLTDLIVSLPREHYRAHLHPRPMPATEIPDGLPAFRVLTLAGPSRGALALGGVLAMITLAAMPGAITRYGTFGSPHLSGWELPSVRVEAPIQPSAPIAVTPAIAEPRGLAAAERHDVVEAAARNLEQHYSDAAVARSVADSLRAHEKNGDYDAVTDAEAFAGLLTKELRGLSDDPRLHVEFSRTPLPERPPAPSAERSAQYQQAMRQQNCTFEQVAILENHIGYLKLNSFPDPSVCGTAAEAAMASLNDTRAIIFDLRDNAGGYPAMVSKIAAYLFDHPEYLYNPRDHTTRESWTQPVPGSRLADKPVFVLTSARTASGAEQFCYDLKMLKRATLVGETTRGAEHSGAFRRIHEHFGMGIPEANSINPFADRGWEGTGVEPDVKVGAADALGAAKGLARNGRYTARGTRLETPERR